MTKKNELRLSLAIATNNRAEMDRVFLDELREHLIEIKPDAPKPEPQGAVFEELPEKDRRHPRKGKREPKRERK